MSKIALENVQTVLAELKIEPDKQDKILQELQKIIEDEKQDRAENKIKRDKPELGVILIDELNELKIDNISALVYELPANSDHGLVMDNLSKAVKEFNNTKKGQKAPIKSVTEIFQFIKPKILKNNGNIKKKCKEPVRCLKTSNKV